MHKFHHFKIPDEYESSQETAGIMTICFYENLESAYHNFGFFYKYYNATVKTVTHVV
jgi:hypothetical protein